MRVIAGKYKGRVLQSAGDTTRPTLDRTKETLFNILQMRIANSTVLDLFAVSGINPKVGKVQETMMPDGLHPNDTGYQRLFELIDNAIKYIL